jgi:nitroimidazol reductase NimA-like FMN-containing flavoprotein (pyridoxamine 5'-phosphate oxidase superfamily)
VSETTSNWSDVATVLDEGWILHLAILGLGQTPISLPLLYVRDERSLLLHGAVGNELLRGVSGTDIFSGTVTLIDGLVAARSAFQSSVAYRSVIIRGRLASLKDGDKEAALVLITDGLIPGRRDEIRDSVSGEVRATTVLRMDILDATLRLSPLVVDDTVSDRHSDVWAGVVPLTVEAGPPQVAPDVPFGTVIPPSIRAWRPRRG